MPSLGKEKELSVGINVYALLSNAFVYKEKNGSHMDIEVNDQFLDLEFFI